jgi:hypothetical protein
MASGGSPPISPAVDSGWERPATTFFQAPAVRTKSNTALTNFAAFFGSTSTSQTCWAQFISDPLVGDQTVAGTVSIVVRGLEGSTSNDVHLAFVLRIVTPAGATRGILRTQLAAATEFTTSAQTRIFSALALTDVNALHGDYVVMEVGLHGVTPANSTTNTLRFGDPTGVADFALTSGLTTDLVPWFELSQNLVFTSPEVLLDGSAAGSGILSAVLTARAAISGVISGSGELLGFPVGVVNIGAASASGSSVLAGVLTERRITSLVELVEGTTVRASWPLIVEPADWLDEELAITGTQMGTIVDATNLRVRITSTGIGGARARYSQVYLAPPPWVLSTVDLLEGITVRKTWQVPEPTAWTDEGLTLTAGEMATITDWPNIRIRITSSGSGGVRARYSNIILETPEGAPAILFDPATISGSGQLAAVLTALVSFTAASLAGTSTLAGPLQGIAAFDPTALNGSGALTGEVARIRALSALVQGFGDLDADQLSAEAHLAASLVGSSVLAGPLSGRLVLTGSLSGDSLIISDLTVEGEGFVSLTATMEGQSALAGTLLGLASMSGAFNGSGELIGQVVRLVALGQAFQGSGSVSGDLYRLVALDGTFIGLGVFSGIMAPTGPYIPLILLSEPRLRTRELVRAVLS